MTEVPEPPLPSPERPPPIEPGAGAIAFCAVVIVTILASMAFDPRLMWDALDERRDRGGRLLRV